jgi:hypothetical protein
VPGVKIDMALVRSEPTGRGRRTFTDSDRSALAESHHLVLNRPRGIPSPRQPQGRIAHCEANGGLIAQSAAMIGFGLAGTAVAWILVKRSSLREVSTKVDDKELSPTLTPNP